MEVAEVMNSVWFCISGLFNLRFLLQNSDLSR